MSVAGLDEVGDRAARRAPQAVAQQRVDDQGSLGQYGPGLFARDRLEPRAGEHLPLAGRRAAQVLRRVAEQGR